MGRRLGDPRLVLCCFCAVITLIVAFQFRTAVKRTAWKSPPPLDPRGTWRLSVVIPARNEAADLGRSLETVLRQQGVELEVIVINDHSTDRTGAIADLQAALDPRVTVIHDPELLPGWLGKSNAMQKGAARATGDFLLFSDADIMHQPTCFVTALAEMDRRGLDFLSLFPRMQCVSLWENIILPSLVGGMAMFATPGIEDPDSPDALAAGAFLMIRASAFAAIGGFEPIKHEMLDDVALAKLLKRNRYRVGLHMAPQLLAVRLYKGNSHAFWGMTKNILEGLSGKLWMAPAAMLLPVFLFWMPIYCLVVGIVERDVLLFAVAAATYACRYAPHLVKPISFRVRPRPGTSLSPGGHSQFRLHAPSLYLYSLRGAVEWRGQNHPGPRCANHTMITRSVRSLWQNS